MISKTQTENYLRSVELPEATNSYAVISHGEIIDTVREMLTANGFTITAELYKGEAKGNIALGFMQLENDLDPDMSMTFNWANSYNKQVKFGCAIGGFIYDNQTPFVSGTSQGKWNRKHTGTALDETKAVIQSMIESANDHFAEIIAMKEQFKSIQLSRKDYAKLSGLFFFDKMLISPDQTSVLRQEYDKPSVVYKDKGTLWEYYKMLMFAIADQAPKNWYKQQTDISNYINILYSISKSDLAIGENFLPETNIKIEEPDVVDETDTASEVTEQLKENQPIEYQEVAADLLDNERELMFGLEITESKDLNHDLEVEEESSEIEYEVEEFDETEIIDEDLTIPAIEMSEEEVLITEEELGIKTAHVEQDLPTENEEEIESLFSILEEEETTEEEEVPWYESEEEKEQSLAQENPTANQQVQVSEEISDMLAVGYDNKKHVVQVTEKSKYNIVELNSGEFFAIAK